MKFELSERLIREWCEKVFQFEDNFDIFEPRYCSLIKITHIRWGNNNNAVQMTNHIKNRINLHQDTFGDIEYIRVFQHGKKDGPIEKDTVGELKFKDNTSNFYALALFNEVFYVNGVKCVFKPSNFSDDREDFGQHIHSKLKNCYSNIVRNIYVNTFAKYEFVWCNLCCWFGLPEDLGHHVNLKHYGQEDVAVYERIGQLNKEKSTQDGVLKFIEVDCNKQLCIKDVGAEALSQRIEEEISPEIVSGEEPSSEIFHTPLGSTFSLIYDALDGNSRSRGMGRGIKKI
jgi:hypothetical protein